MPVFAELSTYTDFLSPDGLADPVSGWSALDVDVTGVSLGLPVDRFTVFSALGG